MEQTKTIKTENGELYVQGDKIVGRMEIMGNMVRWYKGDKLHRDGDLPVFIERNYAGVVIYEAYWRDGKYHRDGDLPAIIWRNEAGAVTCEEYWRDGVKILAEQIVAKKSQELASINEKFTQELAAAKAELTAERAKVADLQAQLDQLKQKIKVILE